MKIEVNITKTLVGASLLAVFAFVAAALRHMAWLSYVFIWFAHKTPFNRDESETILYENLCMPAWFLSALNWNNKL